MAVMDVLSRRHISSSNCCPVCENGVETIIHSLFKCKYATVIWDYCGFRNDVNNAPSSSFADRLCWMANHLTQAQLLEFSALAWAAWYCRNQHVHEEGTSIEPIGIARGFVKLVMDYGVYNAKVSGMNYIAGVQSASSWSLPPFNVLKITVDAHVKNSGGVQLGVVIRDSEGQLVLTAVKRVALDWNAELAEAAAARYRVEIALRHGLDSIILEGDALAVNKQHEGFNPVFVFYEDVLRMKEVFNVFSCNHVKRAGNTVAHLVARWDPGPSGELICMNSFPQSIYTLTELDLI